MRSTKLLRNTSIFLLVLLYLTLGAQARKTPEAVANADNLAGQAEALLALSERQNYENHALALQTAQQALGLWQTLADNNGIARAYAMTGRCHFAQSNLAEAIQNYEQALGLWRDLHNTKEEAEILIMLGYIEFRKGEWANSIAFLSQAQSLIAGDNDPFKMGQIASGLGAIYNETGSPENGLIQYQRALDYYRQTPDTDDDALTIWAIGSTSHLLGDYPQALAHLQQALAGVTPDGLYAALCREYLGKVYLSLGDLPVALEHLQSALAIYTRAVNPGEEARVLGLIGQVYQQQGKLERARQSYQNALVIFGKLSDRVNQAAIYYALGALELQCKNYPMAEDYLRQYGMAIAGGKHFAQAAKLRRLSFVSRS